VFEPGWAGLVLYGGGHVAVLWRSTSGTCWLVVCAGLWAGRLLSVAGCCECRPPGRPGYG
jgi:hypothetical protein